MIEKIGFYLILLLVCVGVAIWNKIKAWRHPGEVPDDAGAPEPPGEHYSMVQGVAGTFLVKEPIPYPGLKEYKAVLRAVSGYPQTREGAEAFLTDMAKEWRGHWVATAVVGVAEENADRAMRIEAIRMMRPLDEVNLFSKAEDCDEEEDEAGESENDRSWISVEFIGDRLGFLEPKLAAEIVQEKEEERVRMISIVLEITGSSDEDRGIDLGVLRWEESEAEQAE